VSVAPMVAAPGSIMPRTSERTAMVEAVPMVLHVPTLAE
jgi:hypothetical protein